MSDGEAWRSAACLCARSKAALAILASQVALVNFDNASLAFQRSFHECVLKSQTILIILIIMP
jgi:hypothetical protein